MSSRILITGGAGFQGSHLAEWCVNAGYQVTILSTYSEEAVANISPFAPNVSVVWGSVTDPEIVQKTVRGQDIVVHLAARINVDQSIRSPASFLDVNVTGTFNILEAVRQEDNRLIYGSSCEVYGATQNSPLTESSDLRPHSPYAATKAAADRLCFGYWKTYGIDLTIMRPCNIYGPRQRSGKHGAVIPIFVDRALAQTPPVVYGAGDQRREYMHVSDLVAGYILAIEKTGLEGEVINLGTGETPSIKEIAERIAGRLGVSLEYAPARPGEVRGFKLDSRKARGLGFVPQVSFWDGLLSYIDSKKSERLSSP